MMFASPLLLACLATAATITPRHESSQKKISYGTYTVPSRKHDNGMLHFYVPEPLAPPCSNCFITSMQAHLEYVSDGSVADADTGMWMHHVVFENLGREDPVCGGDGERFFASGNERGAIDFGESQEGHVGYWFEEGDQIGFGGELMNLGEEEVEVEVSVTWGVVEDVEERDMERVTPYWLDIGGCGSSERPAANDSFFSYTSPPLSSDEISGKIIFVGAHLHDGGSKLSILRNGEPLCTSTPEYRHDHISTMPPCVDAGVVSKGDEWRIKADYDTYTYAPMLNADGSLEPIMGIALAYVLQTDDKPAPHKSSSNGWVISFFILIALAIMGGVGYVLWNRRRVAVWPRWAGGRARYSSLDGPGRGEGEGEAFVGDDGEDEEENVWARQTRGSVRLPGGDGRLSTFG